MLTWSLGWTGSLEPITPPASSMARLEMTSLAFMLVWVPLPVCQIAQREVVVERALGHLAGRPLDEAGARLVELAQIDVDLRRGAPSGSRRPGSAAWASVSSPMAKWCRLALGLGAPVAVGGDLDRRPWCRSRCACSRSSLVCSSCRARDVVATSRVGAPPASATARIAMPPPRGCRGRRRRPRAAAPSPSPGTSRMAGRPRRARGGRAARRAPSAPMVPSPMFSWRSRLAPELHLRVVEVQAARRSRPTRPSTSSTTASASATDADSPRPRPTGAGCRCTAPRRLVAAGGAR